MYFNLINFYYNISRKYIKLKKKEETEFIINKFNKGILK